MTPRPRTSCVPEQSQSEYTNHHRGSDNREWKLLASSNGRLGESCEPSVDVPGRQVDCGW